ncbi:MAG: amino acid adenylation domain-containing protein [Candidatus Hydrogenedentes bacterium]|nr:amino acid adenylation domain-containing protein [Candidatus Hydrogenedentota bacterium]
MHGRIDALAAEKYWETWLPRHKDTVYAPTFRGILGEGSLDIYERSNLTRAQLVFYLGQKLQPTIPLYNNAMVLYIPQALDPALFARAFQKAVDNTDALRTIIEVVDGAPQQRVLDSMVFDLECVDLTGASDYRIATQEWCTERCQVVHDMGKRLFDSVLLKLGDELYGWYLNQHHIISDAFSFVILTGYMSHLYEAAMAGTLDSVPCLPPFKDYLEYERSHRGDASDASERAYWREQLARKVEPINLYGKTIVRQLGTVSKVRHNLGIERTLRIKALAEQDPVAAKTQHAAVFNVFAAALVAYLHRLSGSRRISIGMPFHNRRSGAQKMTPGIFIGVLPLTVDIDDDDTLQSLVAKVGEQAAASLKNSRYYFHNLMHMHAQDVLLNFLAFNMPEFAGTASEVRWIQSGYGTEPLTLSVFENPVNESFGIGFDFNRAYFDDALQTLAIRHIDNVLDAMIANPELAVSQVSLVGEDELRRLVVEFNDTAVGLPLDRTVVGLFEETAAKHPDAIALLYGEERTTYAELNERANRLAHYLRTLGVTSETVVGLCVERSTEMIVGILGIMKAGGAYVPMDPSYPHERLKFFLDDTKTPVLVTQSGILSALPKSGARVVCIDSDWAAIAQCDGRNPEPGASSTNLAYVIYTSGSTGLPKGVMIEHRGLTNMALNARDLAKLSVGDRVLQFASMSFDASAMEIFPTLCAGSTLCLASKETVTSSRELRGLLQQHNVNVVLLTPSYLKTLSPEDLPDLKTVIVGGEACPPALAAQWAASRRFINAYGPTETSVYVTAAQYDGDGTEAPAIGKPIANMQVFVLDDRMRPAPFGVAGELYIGGVGLARGYLNRPELTEDRFVPNPFAQIPGERLYRTGDIVRYRMDGNLEFIGRTDHQVKIRGYRIELGEIESVLQDHPDVAETVVMAREDVPQDRQLVAYIVPRERNKSFNGELKSQLKKLLPEYMIPSAFVVLDELPMTPNGKVDLKALPQPEREDRNMRGPVVLPRDAVELELVHIWEQVFDVRPIGVTDNFFDLGGHSLSAVYLMDQILQKFDRLVPPTALFESPTIEQMAAVLRNQATDEPVPVIVPIQPRGSKPPFFCVHPAPGTVFCYMALAKHMGEDRPFYGIQAPSVNGARVVFDSIEETARHYVSAVRAVQPEGPYYLGGHSSGGVVALELARLLKAEGCEVGAVVLLDSIAPLPAQKAAQVYSACQATADDAFWLACVLMLVEFFFQTRFDISYSTLKRLPVDEQYEAVLDSLKKVGFVPPNSGPGAIHGLVENVKMTSNAAVKYAPPVFDGKVVFVHTRELFTSIPRGAKQHTIVMFWRALRQNWRAVLGGLPYVWADSFSLARRSGLLRRLFGDPTLGWKRYSTQPVDVASAPGNHITMLIDPNAKELAIQVRAALDALSPAQPRRAVREREANIHA